MRHKIQTIQNLRGFAALAVLVHHIFLDTKKYGSESFLIDNFYSLEYFGNIGVDIFFIISGFIMVLIHGNDFKKFHGIRTFFLKRIIRIIPLYWFLTGVAAFILFFFPHLFGQGKTFDLYHTIASFLFIPWQNTAGMPIPILAAGWTLNYEMYFYCIFALFLLFSKNKFIPGISVFFIISMFLHYILENNSSFIEMATNPLLIEFLFGIYIGTMYRKKIFIKQYKLLLIISIILFLSNIPLPHSISYRVIYLGIPSALLIYSLLVYEHNKKNPLCNNLFGLLGTISYSLYLSHVFIYKFIIKIYPQIFGIKTIDLMILFSIISSILGAIIIYKFIEKPITNFLTNKLL